MSDPFQSILGIKASSVLAGLAGGLVRSLILPGLTVRQAIVSCIIGALTAGYLTPAAVEYWPFEASQGIEGAFGYAIGLSAMLICEGVIRAARHWRDDPKLPGKSARGRKSSRSI